MLARMIMIPENSYVTGHILGTTCLKISSTYVHTWLTVQLETNSELEIISLAIVKVLLHSTVFQLPVLLMRNDDILSLRLCKWCFSPEALKSSLYPRPSIISLHCALMWDLCSSFAMYSVSSLHSRNSCLTALQSFPIFFIS